MRITVKADIDRAIRALNEVQRQVVPRAASRALTKTATQARTEASRQIRDRYNISARLVARQIDVTRSTPDTLVAFVKPRGSKLPVVAFQARQTRRGVTVQIKRGSRRLIPHAFIATMRSGHTGVFARGVYSGPSFVHRSKRLRRYPKPDLPITELFTVGVPQAFASQAVLDALERKVRQRFPQLLDHEIRFELSRQ